MKSNNYWENRAAQRMYDYMDQAEATAAEIGKAYQMAAQQLEEEMKHIFSVFQGGMSEAEARRLLNQVERVDYNEIKKLYNSLPDGEVKDALLKQLNAPAYKARIARLQKLSENLELKCKALYQIEVRKASDAFRDTVQEAYYRTTFDLQKGTGLAYSFADIDERRINQILANNWSGEHFSKRIWGDTQKLADTVKQELLVGFMTGKSNVKIAKAIEERFAVGSYEARRLIRTETCYIANQAEMESYKEADIEKYRFVATLDNRTSEICQELDGKVFTLDKQQPGVNCPPMHPFCRSTTIAEFCEDVMSSLIRRARDPETGRTYTVPANMSYKEWRKSLQKDKDGLMVPHPLGDKTPHPLQKETESFQKVLEKSTGEEKHIGKMKLYAATTEYVEKPDSDKAFYYSRQDDVIYFNPSAPNFDNYDMDYVQAHELSHRMDILEYQSYNNSDFLDAIDVSRQIVADHKDEIQSWFTTGGKFENDMAVSDLISALSENGITVTVGHKNDYWERPDMVPMEIFANLSAIDVLGRHGKEELEELFSALFGAYKGVVK